MKVTFSNDCESVYSANTSDYSRRKSAPKSELEAMRDQAQEPQAQSRPSNREQPNNLFGGNYAKSKAEEKMEEDLKVDNSMEVS